jgi:hypothetical protein
VSLNTKIKTPEIQRRSEYCLILLRPFTSFGQIKFKLPGFSKHQNTKMGRAGAVGGGGGGGGGG